MGHKHLIKKNLSLKVEELLASEAAEVEVYEKLGFLLDYVGKMKVEIDID